jgi:arylsulfatase B
MRFLSAISVPPWFVFVAAFLGCATGPTPDGVRPAPDRPNIILLFVDDLGYGELGCQGNPEIPTPHIDALARQGVRCTSGYVTASYCSPSRAGILTGRYQTRFGYELNPVGRNNLDPKAGLPVNEPTIADHLKKAGYATGLVGKWHLGGTEAYHPQKRGFDAFFGFLHEGHFYVPPPYAGVTSFLRRKTLPPGAEGTRFVEGDIVWSSHRRRDEPPYDDHNPVLRGRRPVREEAYLTDALTREAVSFIERNADGPFFLYLAYNAVHSPMQGAARYMKRFGHIPDIHRRVFAAMLANLDDSVGAVMETLRARGLERRTLVFLISDNGGPTAELTSSNAPLRGGKGTFYEGGLRVPFLVQWKGTLPAGTVYDRPVCAVDVLPTATAAAGIALPADRTRDGVDLLPFLSGRNAARPHDTLFWRMGRWGALRQGDWKLVLQRPHRGGEPRAELYDLANDIGEAKDLARTRADTLRKMLDAWKQLDAEMIEPVWTPR